MATRTVAKPTRLHVLDFEAARRAQQDREVQALRRLLSVTEEELQVLQPGNVRTALERLAERLERAIEAMV